MALDLKKLIKQGSRYLIVGFSSVAIELTLFWLLYELIGYKTALSFVGLSLVPSNVIAILVATLYNFIMSRKWTFQSTSSLPRSITLYLILFVFNQVFSSTVIVLLVDVGVHSMLAKVITIACIVCWNFVLYRTVVFK
ncbi:MAG: GtrA family protein [Coriobacteriia bacterium]|nr:GtrA family protein [Coriobacteriia bacterium]